MITPDESDAAILLSREELRQGDSDWVTRERVRVRRRIVTHTVSVPVTIRREELVIERMPLPGQPIDHLHNQPHPPVEVLLREEVPVVALKTQAYEHVRVSVISVTGEQTFHAMLGSEQLEIQTDRVPSPEQPRDR